MAQKRNFCISKIISESQCLLGFFYVQKKNKKDVNTDEVIEIIKKICDNFIDITNKEIQNGSININYPKNYLFLIISTCLFPFTTPYIIESVINMSMEEFYEKHYEYMKYILLKEIEILK